MIFENFFIKLIGGQIAKKIKLEDGPMDSAKKWYQSKGVWTGIVTFALGVYGGVNSVLLPALGHTPLPVIPDWLLTLLGAIGVYSRMTAEKTIG